MKLPDQLRDPQITQTAGPALRLAILAAADRIEQLEATVARLEARGITDMQHRIEELEAELARCHYFLRVIAGHAEDISTEVGCALHPQIVVGGPSDD